MGGLIVLKQLFRFIQPHANTIMKTTPSGLVATVLIHNENAQISLFIYKNIWIAMRNMDGSRRRVDAGCIFSIDWQQHRLVGCQSKKLPYKIWNNKLKSLVFFSLHKRECSLSWSLSAKLEEKRMWTKNVEVKGPILCNIHLANTWKVQQGFKIG